MTVLLFIYYFHLKKWTSIAYTAMGGVVSERAGVINIGLEGVMTASAFAAVAGAYISGSPWIGVLFAILIGIAISAVHAVVCITCGGNQSVKLHGLDSPGYWFQWNCYKSNFRAAGNYSAGEKYVQFSTFGENSSGRRCTFHAFTFGIYISYCIADIVFVFKKQPLDCILRM